MKTTAPLSTAIDAFAVEYEASRRTQSSDWRVRLYMADKLGVDEATISDRDVHYFIQRMGAVYLARKVQGIGATIAERLCREAAEALAQ